MAEGNRIMTHLVAGYPSMEESRKAATAMAEGGASWLEIQFPFSDPVADGPLIQGACTDSLAAGFTVDKGFGFVTALAEELEIPLFIMTYGNIVVAAGVEIFVKKAVEAGAAGLIIPDLPFDYDEGLYEAGIREGMPVVPVVIPGIETGRLDAILAAKPPYVYTAIRKGITGAKSAIGEETLEFLDRLTGSETKVLAGFGIRDREQVEVLAPHVHGAVVGSALVELIGKCSEAGRSCSGPIRDFVASLV